MPRSRSRPAEDQEEDVAAGRPDKPARARIFDVARDLFYRQGIRAVGVDTIVAQAGATKMSLYRCFPSKDDLVAAYLKERDEVYWRWWDETVARYHGKPRQQIRALCQAIAKRAAQPGYRGCAFTNAATEFPDPAHPGRAVALANKRELRERLRRLAEALGARDPALLGDQLFLLIEGVYASCQVMGTTGPAAGLPEAAEALIAAQLR
ncbi:MAG: TetR/AcrR family transcriptional regulator [Proteobacteria bacterium]|nr:TetR/AcrR family transcriptional regulator [Pseudomonadota bacterium]